MLNRDFARSIIHLELFSYVPGPNTKTIFKYLATGSVPDTKKTHTSAFWGKN